MSQSKTTILNSFSLVLILAVSLAADGAKAKVILFRKDQIERSTPLKEFAPIIILAVGESQRVRINAGHAVHVSNGSVVRVRTAGRDLILTGQKLGAANLRVGEHREADRWIVVTEKATRGLFQKFTDETPKLRGLTLDLESLPLLVIKGELLRLSDYQKLAVIAQRGPLPWRLYADIFPSVVPKLQSSIQRQMLNLGFADLKTTVQTQAFSVRLPAQMNQKENQVKQLRALGLEVNTDENTPAMLPMIRTEVVLAEVKKEVARTLGVHWPTSIAAQVSESGFNLTQLTIALSALENQGQAHVLARPNLLCRSGGTAKFFAGGELPIRLVNVHQQHVEWKKFGIDLSVQPTADAEGRIQVQLSTEVSSLDAGISSDGIPGLATARFETQFNLRSTRTIVLSGLIRNDSRSQIEGIPGLKSLPLLGELFSSQSFLEKQSELIAFVTPQVIAPSGESVENQ